MSTVGFLRWGFEDFEEYKASMKTAYKNIGKRAFSPKYALEELDKTTPLPRTLNWFHVRCVFVVCGPMGGGGLGPLMVGGLAQ